jgi:hypothetical protein
MDAGERWTVGNRQGSLPVVAVGQQAAVMGKGMSLLADRDPDGE